MLNGENAWSRKLLYSLLYHICEKLLSLYIDIYTYVIYIHMWKNKKSVVKCLLKQWTFLVKWKAKSMWDISVTDHLLDFLPPDICIYSASKTCHIYYTWNSWVILLKVTAVLWSLQRLCIIPISWALSSHLLLIPIIMNAYAFFLLFLKYWVSLKCESWVDFHSLLLPVTVFS